MDYMNRRLKERRGGGGGTKTYGKREEYRFKNCEEV